ncbi:predicted protein [Postia placenta Mad-698-R]|nr:predicted protein [Postia placenta Mad-698-R]
MSHAVRDPLARDPSRHGSRSSHHSRSPRHSQGGSPLFPFPTEDDTPMPDEPPVQPQVPLRQPRPRHPPRSPPQPTPVPNAGPRQPDPATAIFTQAFAQIAQTLQLMQQGQQHGSAGRKPVVNKPKDFDGDKELYEKWKMEMRLFIADHQISDDNRKTNVIVSYIRGPKVDAFVRILYNTNCAGGYWQISSTELWNILDEHYVDASLKEKAQQKIEYIRQGSRSADDYIVEFEDLASQAGYRLADEHNGAPVSAALTETGEFARRKKLCGAATTATQMLLEASQHNNRLVKLLQQHHKELLGSYQWPESHTSRGGMEQVLCTKEVDNRCR